MYVLLIPSEMPSKAFTIFNSMLDRQNRKAVIKWTKWKYAYHMFDNLNGIQESRSKSSYQWHFFPQKDCKNIMHHFNYCGAFDVRPEKITSRLYPKDLMMRSTLLVWRTRKRRFREGVGEEMISKKWFTYHSSINWKSILSKTLEKKGNDEQVLR